MEHSEPSSRNKFWAKKCAGSGLLFNHLQLIFQRDCVQGVSDVLYVDINNKPRVTKN